MRNWMRLGNLAVGLHYSPAFRFYRSPGARHRSHGCYRMGRKSSDYVFKWAPIGTPVHVVRYLGGTEWQFLVAQTPAELLPGNQASRAASAPARRSAPSRSTGAGKPARKAAAAKPRNPAPVPEPVVSEPVPAPAPEPATAEPPQSAEPEPMPARALDSSANFPTAPETEPAPPIGLRARAVSLVMDAACGSGAFRTERSRHAHHPEPAPRRESHPSRH